MTFERFLANFDPFCPFLGPFGAKNGSKWPKIGQKWAKMGQKWGQMGHFWVILDHFWVHPRSFWVAWGSFYHFFASFGVVLVLFWPHFEAFLGPFWAIFVPFLGRFSPILGLFHGHFAIFWWCFGKLTAKSSKMMQEKANICEFLPKFTKIMQNCPKTSPFFGYKTLDKARSQKDPDRSIIRCRSATLSPTASIKPKVMPARRDYCNTDSPHVNIDSVRAKTDFGGFFEHFGPF